MVNVYAVAFGIGGTLLLLTLVFGAGGDADVDGGDVGDGGGDSGDGGEIGFGSFIEIWLPIASLRFWTFFAAFFGLVGLVLSYSEVIGPSFILPVAVFAGWTSAANFRWMLNRFSKKSVSLQTDSRKWIGEFCKVTLPLAEGGIGKVAIEVDGTRREAEAKSEVALAAGTKVMVVGVSPDGYLQVQEIRKEGEG